MSTIEQKIHDTIVDTVKILGFDIVRIRMLGRAGSPHVLEILIERLDLKHVSIGDCSIVSDNISAILDVEDAIDYTYNLEVSSAGIERPLIKLSDYIRFQGYVVAIKLHKAVDTTKKYQGRILSVIEDKIVIGCAQDVTLEFENIKDAKLVLTDELFRKIIKS